MNVATLRNKFTAQQLVYGAIAVAILIAILFGPDLLSKNRYVSLAVTTFIFAIASYGLFFLFSQSGQMSVAHGALMGLSGYTVALLQIHYEIGFWYALPIAVLVCVFAGLLLALPSMRVSGHYFLIVTFAFAQFFVLTGNNWVELTNGRDGLIVRENPDGFGIANFRNVEHYYYLCAGFLVLTIAIVTALRQTTFCRTMRAARENEALAYAMGMNVQQARFIAFAISGIFPGIAGALYVYQLHHIEPNTFGIVTGVNLILMLILGGGQVLLGPLLGAATFTYLPEVIGLSPNMSRTVFGGLLVASILLLKKGVAGTFKDIIDRAIWLVSYGGKHLRGDKKDVTVRVEEGEVNP